MSHGRAGPAAEPVPPKLDADDGFERVNAEDVPPAAVGDGAEGAPEGDDGHSSLFSLRKPRDVTRDAMSTSGSAPALALNT